MPDPATVTIPAVPIPIADLKPHPRNYRTHPDDQIAHIAQSIREHGFYRNVVIADDNTLLAGHGVVLAATSLGLADVPAVRMPFGPDDPRALKILTGDNELGLIAEVDHGILSGLLAEIREVDVSGLLGTGYSEQMLADLLTIGGDVDPVSAQEKADTPISPVPEVPITRTGDLWILGDHRLLCGDAFDTMDRKRLLDGFDTAMVLTDPPFAIYGSSSGVSSSVADDKMVRPFFEQLGQAILEIVPYFAHAYVCCDWRSYATLWDAFKRSSLTPKNCLVWDKGSAGLGSNYVNTHEFVAFFVKMPPQQTMTTVSGSQTRQRTVSKPNVLRYPRVTGDERQHNAAKPVPMLAALIENGCDEGAGVLDLFGGSGSTLIAAHSVHRRAAMMEMEPAWCDVIARRWEKYTGETAILERTGEAMPPVEDELPKVDAGRKAKKP